MLAYDLLKNDGDYDYNASSDYLLSRPCKLWNRSIDRPTRHDGKIIQLHVMDKLPLFRMSLLHHIRVGILHHIVIQRLALFKPMVIFRTEVENGKIEVKVGSGIFLSLYQKGSSIILYSFLCPYPIF